MKSWSNFFVIFGFFYWTVIGVDSQFQTALTQPFKDKIMQRPIVPRYTTQLPSASNQFESGEIFFVGQMPPPPKATTSSFLQTAVQNTMEEKSKKQAPTGFSYLFNNSLEKQQRPSTKPAAFETRFQIQPLKLSKQYFFPERTASKKPQPLTVPMNEPQQFSQIPQFIPFPLGLKANNNNNPLSSIERVKTYYPMGKKQVHTQIQQFKSPLQQSVFRIPQTIQPVRIQPINIDKSKPQKQFHYQVKLPEVNMPIEYVPSIRNLAPSTPYHYQEVRAQRLTKTNYQTVSQVSQRPPLPLSYSIERQRQPQPTQISHPKFILRSNAIHSAPSTIPRNPIAEIFISPEQEHHEVILLKDTNPKSLENQDQPALIELSPTPTSPTPISPTPKSHTKVYFISDEPEFQITQETQVLKPQQQQSKALEKTKEEESYLRYADKVDPSTQSLSEFNQVTSLRGPLAKTYDMYAPQMTYSAYDVQHQIKSIS